MKAMVYFIQILIFLSLESGGITVVRGIKLIGSIIGEISKGTGEIEEVRVC